MVKDPTAMESALAKYQPNRGRRNVVGREDKTEAPELPKYSQPFRKFRSSNRLKTRFSEPENLVRQDNTGQWIGGRVAFDNVFDGHAESPYRLSRRERMKLKALARDRKIKGQFDLRSNVLTGAQLAAYADRHLGKPRLVPTITITFNDGSTMRATVAQIQGERGK